MERKTVNTVLANGRFYDENQKRFGGVLLKNKRASGSPSMTSPRATTRPPRKDP